MMSKVTKEPVLTPEQLANQEADRKARVEKANAAIMQVLTETNTKFDITVLLREGSITPVLKVVSR